jgi:hypothetical protein
MVLPSSLAKQEAEEVAEREMETKEKIEIENWSRMEWFWSEGGGRGGGVRGKDLEKVGECSKRRWREARLATLIGMGRKRTSAGKGVD